MFLMLMIYFEYAYSKKSSLLLHICFMNLFMWTRYIEFFCSEFRLQGFFLINIIKFNKIKYFNTFLKVYIKSLPQIIKCMLLINIIIIGQETNRNRFYNSMSKLPSVLKGISHEVESQYSQQNTKQQIPKAVLDKYLRIGNKQVLDKIDGVIDSIKPVWSLSLPEFKANLIGIVKSDWPFSQQNKSIYLVVWGPITLIFLCYLLHSDPYEKNIKMYVSAGLIHLGLIVLLAFFGYVYSNILKFPFNHFLQHASVSSHVNLITIIYCCVCMGGPQWLIIISAFIYVGICSYLHFNLYNQSIKPTLLQFIILLVFILVIYGCAAYLFTNTFRFPIKSENSLVNHKVQRNINNHSHFGIRKFDLEI